MLRDLRHRAEYAGFVVVHRLIRLLPHRFAPVLGGLLSRCFLLFGKRRRLMFANLEASFPELRANEIRSIAARAARNIGASFFEEASATRFEAAVFSQRFEIDGWEHIEKLEQAGQRYLMVTAHFGPFDFVVYPLAQRLGPINIVVQSQANPYTRKRSEPMQTHVGAVLMPRHRAGARMLTLLRKGDNVGLAIDQRVRPWDGILIPFLGRYCWTSPVPAFLCQRLQIPVVPVFCQPESPGRYRLLVREPIWPDDLGEDPTYELTCRHHQAVEREVRRDPARWFWVHGRWRLTWQHSYEKSLVRLKRESGLPEPKPSEEQSKNARALDRWLTGKRLEHTDNVGLTGLDADKRREASIATGRRVVERGYGVRYFDVDDWASNLAAAEARGELSIELRKLDACPLLILDGDVGSPEARAGVLEALRHRRPRGSVLLSVPELDEELAVALDPATTLSC